MGGPADRHEPAILNGCAGPFKGGP
jgi:hypothetical protein